METQKKEQCRDTHNRAGFKMACSVCVGVCAYVSVCVPARTMCSPVAANVCAYMEIAFWCLNVCVHAHMYQHVTMTASCITLVKEIGSGSASECQC